MARTVERAMGATLAVVLAALLASCSSDSGGGPSDGVDAGGEGGSAGQGGAGGAGDDGGVVDLLRVPATVTAFGTIGQPRSGDGATVSGDGFEYGERLCTANGLFCVTGGFGP